MSRSHIFLLAAIPFFAACSHGHSHEEAAVHDDHEHAPGVIVLDGEAAERFGVVTDTLSAGDFHSVVRAAGRVMQGGSQDALVVSPVAGTVRYARGIEPGTAVSKGAVVASIETSTVSGGDANAAAAATLANAEKELARVKELYGIQMATRGELNAAQSAYDAARAAYSPAAGSRRATAPTSGTVIQLLAKEGQYVQAGEAIALTGSASASLLRVDLPMRHAADAATYADMTVDIPGVAKYRVSERGGRRSGSQGAGASDAAGGYIPIYFSVNGSGAAAGTPFTAYLIGSPRSNVLTVPVEALSEQQGSYYVYVNTEGHHFAKRLVRPGASDGERVEISGVEPGERVVVRGVSAVRLAETSAVAPQGHSHNH